MHLLDEHLWFPPVGYADPDGLLAVGGDLSVDRLLLAYRSGIFPWYNDNDPLLWWAPDPRFVLFPDELKVTKSMGQVLKKGDFDFKMNTAFRQVIHCCRSTVRKGMAGTWISDDIENAYTELHHAGYAHSAEAWHNGQLVGGLYGILLGKMFFGESMFSLKDNASKFAFINWVRELGARGIVLIDCQVYTAHLESLGARMIPREQFMEMLGKYAWEDT